MRRKRKGKGRCGMIEEEGEGLRKNRKGYKERRV
jgi:hypothetical protein